MPELPEVETTCRGIEPHITNQLVINVVVRQQQLRWPITTNIVSILKEKKVIGIKRRGKYILMNFPHGTLIIHLGMSGRLCVLNGKNNPPQKHDHFDMQFANNITLRYTDPRRFGCILWTDSDPKQHKLLSGLGVEPLEKEFTGKYLFSKSRNKKLAIKQFIMDSKIVVGVGNIYANEALFKAKINPIANSNMLSLEQYNLLASEIKKILKLAIKQGGTTLKDFLSGEGKPGYFSQLLTVYGRGGMPCINCKAELKEIRLGQRTTVFCNECQTT